MSAPESTADNGMPAAERVALRHGLVAVVLGHADVDRPTDGPVSPEARRRRRRQVGAARSRRQSAEARRRHPEAFL